MVWNTNGVSTPPSKKSEILEAERSKDELRDIMTRMVGAEIRYTRLGYWMRMPPYGYMSQRVNTPNGKRTILIPHPAEAKYITTMFELRAGGQYTDEEIAQKINDMGYQGYAKRSLGLRKSQKVGESQRVKMTARQMWRMVRHPIYAGINREKWTDGKPVKCAFEGLVSIELFNHANKDRRIITEHSNGRFTIEDLKAKRYTDKGKRDNIFPYKRFILCPQCRNPLHASSSRGKSGKLYPAYHCRRQKHNFRISKAELEAKVDEFIGKLQLSPTYAEQYMTVVKESWQHLQSQHENRIKEYDKHVAALKTELNTTVQKIKVLNNETAIKWHGGRAGSP